MTTPTADSSSSTGSRAVRSAAWLLAAAGAVWLGVAVNAQVRAGRDSDEWRRRIGELKRTAAGQENVLVPLRSALAAQATVGEVCDALRDVWGTYRPPDIS